MLVRAFLDDALAVVTDDVARGLLEAAVEGWWQRHQAAMQPRHERHLPMTAALHIRLGSSTAHPGGPTSPS